MYTSFMQRAAIGGLFMGIWNSMESTKAYADICRSAQARHSGYVELEVNGRIAKWKTTVGNNYAASWTVGFKDTSLGTIYIVLYRTGIIRSMMWFSGDGNVALESQIHFDDAKFERLFEMLRQSAGAYIKHYGFSVDREKTFLSGIFGP